MASDSSTSESEWESSEFSEVELDDSEGAFLSITSSRKPQYTD